MRARVLALVGLVAATAAVAKDPSPDNIRGLYLTTDFPVVQLRAGEETSLPITIYNYGLKPQRTAIKLNGAPADWKPSLEGSGKPANAAFVDYDGRASMTLKFNIPAGAKPGEYKFTIDAEGEDAKSSLPVTVNLAEPPSRIEKFLEKMPLSFTLLLDRDTKTAKAWQAKILPASYLIGRDGRIRYQMLGELDWAGEHAREKVNELLK